MIFPVNSGNYMNWYMMQEYIHVDTDTGDVIAQDPIPTPLIRSADLQNALQAIRATDQKSSRRYRRQLQEMTRPSDIRPTSPRW